MKLDVSMKLKLTVTAEDEVDVKLEVVMKLKVKEYVEMKLEVRVEVKMDVKCSPLNLTDEVAARLGGFDLVNSGNTSCEPNNSETTMKHLIICLSYWKSSERKLKQHRL